MPCDEPNISGYVVLGIETTGPKKDEDGNLRCYAQARIAPKAGSKPQDHLCFECFVDVDPENRKTASEAAKRMMEAELLTRGVVLNA